MGVVFTLSFKKSLNADIGLYSTYILEYRNSEIIVLLILRRKRSHCCGLTEAMRAREEMIIETTSLIHFAFFMHTCNISMNWIYSIHTPAEENRHLNLLQSKKTSAISAMPLKTLQIMCNFKKIFKHPKYGLHYLTCNSSEISNSKGKQVCIGTVLSGKWQLLLRKFPLALQGVLSTGK